MQRRRTMEPNMEQPPVMCQVPPSPADTMQPEVYANIKRKHEGRRPVRKRHRILGTYFSVCGIAVNIVAIVWLIVRLLVYLNTFIPKK